MHPVALRQAALALIAAGVNDCEVARRLGVPRTTVRDWRRPTYISKPRERLRIFPDARHARVVDEAEALLRRGFPGNRVNRLLRDSMVVLAVYNGHLTCLFPQHGHAKKHERPIVLEPWQETIVAAQSWAFLRGCIRSDGCVFINRTGRYEYLSYCFDNYSPHIRDLFIAACDRVGVVCRPSGTSVRIYRRASVALMAEHVGGKC